MPIYEKDDFIQHMIEPSALLALDVGTKTIGLAVCSALRSSAHALYTIKRKKLQQDAQILFQYYDDYECTGLIIGWPLMRDGTKGKKCQSVRDFTLALLQIRDVPVYFFDERFSSIEAQSIMENDLNMKKKKQKQHIDNEAARIILQNALEDLFSPHKKIIDHKYKGFDI